MNLDTLISKPRQKNVRMCISNPEREQRILKMIENYQAANNKLSPSIREICKATGIASTSMVSGYLNNLEAQGFIERPTHRARSIHVIKSDPVDIAYLANMMKPLINADSLVPDDWGYDALKIFRDYLYMMQFTINYGLEIEGDEGGRVKFIVREVFEKMFGLIDDHLYNLKQKGEAQYG